MSKVRPFVDRVLRLKERQDDLNEDIKEVYAEAKTARLDKTAMGQLVAYLRKRAKNPNTFEEKTAKFEGYLFEYDHGTDHAREDTHAHETHDRRLPPHDSDGVIIEEPGTSFSSLETTSGIGSARETSAMLHPGAVDGSTANLAGQDSGDSRERPAPIPEPVAAPLRDDAPVVVSASPDIPGAPISDPGPMPPFLRRGDPQCAVGRAA